MTTERDYQEQLITLAHILGWRVAHFRPAMTRAGWRTPVQADGVGFPDLILVRGARAVAVEVKSARGRLSVEQGEWLTALEAAGIETHVWYPDDWDTATEVLR